jgi:hypothetical protein
MSAAIQLENQREAVDAILRSRTFHRCDQLKRFLRYICEAEWEGRRQDLTEYSVGVHALGRRADFNPEFDSTVRTRAHALRQKLNDYYAKEDPAATVRVELPRGSYVPCFTVQAAPLEAAPHVEPEHDVDPLPWQSASPEPPPRRRGVWLPYALGLATAVLLAAGAVVGGWIRPGVRATVDPVVLDFWKPWLDSSEAAAICVSQPPQVWVREYGQNALPLQNGPFPDPAPTSGEFVSWYRRRSNTGNAPSNLVLHPSPNAPLWGDAAGGAVAIQFLSRLGAGAHLLPEKTLRGLYPLRGQSLMVFGRPEFSALQRELEPPEGFQVQYLPDVRRHAIVDQSRRSHRYFNSFEQDQENFGVISVLTSPQARPRSTILFSGITSDGSLAGIEFLTSAPHLRILKDKLRAEGHAEWPARFQVIVKTRSSEGYPLETSYVAHKVLR